MPCNTVKFDPKDYTKLSENFKCIVDVTMKFNSNILERINKLIVLLSRAKCVREYHYIFDKIEETYKVLGDCIGANNDYTDDILNKIKLAEKELYFLIQKD